MDRIFTLSLEFHRGDSYGMQGVSVDGSDVERSMTGSNAVVGASLVAAPLVQASPTAPPVSGSRRGGYRTTCLIQAVSGSLIFAEAESWYLLARPAVGSASGAGGMPTGGRCQRGVRQARARNGGRPISRPTSAGTNNQTRF